MKDAVKQLKEKYPPNTRVQMKCMREEPRPIPPGTMGTVDHVDDAGQIHTRWDNGRYLAIIPEVDSFHAL